MPEPLPEDLLERFADLVTDRLGLRFTADRRESLQRGAGSAAAALGFPDAAAMVRSLLAAPFTRERSDVVAMHLTVGETYFFREGEVLQAIREHALPDRPTRIWCAGCSSGEEAYSIAILLDSIARPAARILATDINVGSLRRAAEGTYGPWSFRAMPEPLRDRYFQREPDGRYRIVAGIRSRVDYMYHNLAEDPFPSIANGTNAMDLILCRNVLLYFQPALRQRVVEHFSRCLVDGGCLAVGSVETQQVRTPGLAPAVHGDATLFRKAPAVQPAPPAAPPSRTPPKARAGASTRKPPAARPSATVRGPSAPDPAVHAKEARALADKGELAEALRRCDLALAGAKTEPAYHFLYASILLESGRPDEAMAALRRALYLDKDFVIARFAMGQAARARGRTAESRRHFHAALELLSARAESDVLPESEGVTAGGLAVTIRHLIEGGTEA